MKSRLNSQLSAVLSLIAALGLSAVAVPVQADMEAVSVMAMQTTLIKESHKSDVDDDAGSLATQFTEQILDDLDVRLPTEMDQLIAKAH